MTWKDHLTLASAIVFIAVSVIISIAMPIMVANTTTCIKPTAMPPTWFGRC